MRIDWSDFLKMNPKKFSQLLDASSSSRNELSLKAYQALKRDQKIAHETAYPFKR